MKKKIWVVLTATAALLVLAAAVFATGEYSGSAGSEDDPLVTLSYINDIFTVEVQKFFRQELQTQTDSLRDSLETRIEALEDARDIAADGDGNAAFQKITLSSGSELVCKAGTELLLYSGSAYVIARELPGLLDTSGGVDLSRGEYMEKNHMYLVAADGNGICADGNITVLIRGSYEIESSFSV